MKTASLHRLVRPGREDEIGTIAPGRYADIIAVRGDVLADNGLLQRVDLVVKNGVRVK